MKWPILLSCFDMLVLYVKKVKYTFKNEMESLKLGEILTFICHSCSTP